jgi:ABC-2 type transport system ATP-binding protein
LPGAIIKSEMTSGIVAQKLTKYYGHEKVAALDSLQFDIKPGEIYGYLGANGAGKSTTIRLLMNFLQPTSGTATICGLDVARDSVAIKRRVGYLAGDVALYQRTTGKELLDYLGALQGGADAEFRDKLEKRFEAETTKPVNTLSKGNRQKVGILQAFMHRPDVLILDEPTSGLDPLMQEAFYETVREAKDRGAAILMSSHNLAEAQRVCDRIGIIKHGKLIREQAIDADESLNTPVFEVTFRTHQAIQDLKNEAALQIIQQTDSNGVRVRPRGDIAPALAALSKYDVASMTSQRSDLEDEFLEFYGDQQ